MATSEYMGSHIKRSLLAIFGAAAVALILCVIGPGNHRSDSAIGIMVFTVCLIVPLALAAMCLALSLARKEGKTWQRRSFAFSVYAVYIAFGVNLAGLSLLPFQGDGFPHIKYDFFFLIILPGLFALFGIPLLSAVSAYHSGIAVGNPLPGNIARIKKCLILWAAAILAAAGCMVLVIKNLVIG